jgi:hypothetical protein
MNTVAINPDGDLIVSGGSDKLIKVLVASLSLCLFGSRS